MYIYVDRIQTLGGYPTRSDVIVGLSNLKTYFYFFAGHKFHFKYGIVTVTDNYKIVESCHGNVDGLRTMMTMVIQFEFYITVGRLCREYFNKFK